MASKAIIPVIFFGSREREIEAFPCFGTSSFTQGPLSGPPFSKRVTFPLIFHLESDSGEAKVSSKSISPLT